MSQETYPDQTSEPEAYTFDVYLQGKGAAVPTVINGKGVTIARTSAGLCTLTFAADPGPTFLGLSGFGFLDITPGNAAGWTVVAASFTAQAKAVLATLVFTIFNSSVAAADIAATTRLKLSLRFKVAATKL